MKRIAPLFLALGAALAAQSPDLKLNQIQVIGTHNSYHAGIAPSEKQLWLKDHAKDFQGLDYSHPPLPAQFNEGVRQIELDVFVDSKGGLYATPAAPGFVAAAGLPADPPFDPNHVMSKPGFKVMHMQDVDYRSVCQPFTECLTEVRTWSRAHPDHIPIFILVETKQDKPGESHFTPTEPFTPAAFDTLDAEIRSIFSPSELITPDLVRGAYPTLNAAVLAGNWPTLASARGKVMFLMDQKWATPMYTQGHPSLQGRIIFTNSDPGHPDAAFIERNDGPADKISDLVKQGYLVRTRADSDTREARTDFTTRRDSMIASGAQIISTDYPAAEPAKWDGHYSVSLPGGKDFRCDPVDATCH